MKKHKEMNHLPNFNATFETVWAALQETDRMFKEQNAERRKNEKKSERQMKKIFDGFKKDRLRMKEADRRMKETDRQMQETDRRMQETDRQMQETDRRMIKLQEQLGGWANSHGSFAEEYFFNAFEEGKQDFFGEHFNKISKNLKYVEKNIEDEYDIVMYNNHYVAIVEVKYKAHKNDIPQVIKKAETFRILTSSFKDFKIYLGLASMAFYPELEQECIAQGIAIIKQVGDKVIINDKHLKVF